jgi:hypothetical protein
MKRILFTGFVACALFPALSVIISFFIIGCTLDNPATSSDPPLTLHVEQNLSLITLRWDAVKVTGFKEYILLQSLDDIPDSTAPVVNSMIFLLKRINDNNIDSFTFPNALLLPKRCFKLYTSVDDRFLYSSSVCLDLTFNTFDGDYASAGHETGLKQEVLYERDQHFISLMDYETSDFLNQVSDVNLFSPIFEISTFDDTTHVFAYEQSATSTLWKYKFPELTPLLSRNFNGLVEAISVIKQFVFIHVNQAQKHFQVLDRNSFNLIDSKNGNTGGTGNWNIAVFDGNPIVVLEIDKNTITQYLIDPAGKISQAIVKSSQDNPVGEQNTTANSEACFVAGRFGAIITRDGKAIDFVTDESADFVKMNRFSPDRTKLVSIISNSGSTRLEIRDVSNLAFISLVKSFEIPAVNYSDVIVEEDFIYLLGFMPSTEPPQTFIFKYPT